MPSISETLDLSSQGLVAIPELWVTAPGVVDLSLAYNVIEVCFLEKL